jgi:GGDEF domain-containing protein
MSIEDPAEVLRQGTSAAAMALEADHALLRLRDEDTGRYAIRSYFGSADGRLQERLFRLDKRASVAAIKRRAPVLVRELQADPDFAEFASDVRSLLVAPIQREGSVIGTLALYDKMSPDRFAPGSFGEADVELFTRFVAHLERAIANAQFVWRARQFRDLDDETSLPGAGYAEKRIDEELARAQGRSGALAVAVCRVENLDAIERARDAPFARRVRRRVAEALRANLRDFDVAARGGAGEFWLLLPDPGPAPGDRVSALARSVADDVAKDDALNQPVRIALGFGYAVHPEDGADRDALLSRAATLRIRMV